MSLAIAFTAGLLVGVTLSELDFNRPAPAGVSVHGGRIATRIGARLIELWS